MVKKYARQRDNFSSNLLFFSTHIHMTKVSTSGLNYKRHYTLDNKTFAAIKEDLEYYTDIKSNTQAYVKLIHIDLVLAKSAVLENGNFVHTGHTKIIFFDVKYT